MDQRPIRVLSWNIHGRARPNIDLLAEYVQKLAPDIIGMQEVKKTQAARIAGLLRMSHVWTFKHNPCWPALPSQAEGLAIFSMLPITAVENIVLNAPISRQSHRRRVAQVAKIDINGRSAAVINTHLASHNRPVEREQQARILRRFLDEKIHCPWLITADLNDHEEPMVLRVLEGKDARDSWIEKHGVAGGFTCPSVQPSERIDHIVLSRSFQLVDIDILHPSSHCPVFSDHLALMAVTFLLGSNTSNS